MSDTTSAIPDGASASGAIRSCTDGDLEAVVELWRVAGLTRPWNDARADFMRKRAVQPEMFLVHVDANVVVGTVMAGYDGHRGWLYYLATDPARRGEGIARGLITEAERLLTELGCPKVQLMVRPDNAEVVAFYDALGYEEGDILLLGKRTISDVPDA